MEEKKIPLLNGLVTSFVDKELEKSLRYLIRTKSLRPTLSFQSVSHMFFLFSGKIRRQGTFI